MFDPFERCLEAASIDLSYGSWAMGWLVVLGLTMFGETAHSTEYVAALMHANGGVIW